MERRRQLPQRHHPRVVIVLAGFVVHTKTTLGDEHFAVTTASGPLHEALTDPDNLLAQYYGLPAESIILIKTDVSGSWIKV